MTTWSTAPARLRRYVRSIVQDLRAQPLHQALSALSLSIGAVAMILTMLSGRIATDVFIAKEEQRTAREVTYRAELSGRAWNIDGTKLHTDLQRGLDHVHGSAVLTAHLSGSIREPGGSVNEVGLTAYRGDYPAVRRLPLLQGVWPSDQTLPPAIVVNPAAHLATGDVVGLRIGRARPEVTVTVSGVVADGSADPTYFTPMALCETFLPCAIDKVDALIHSPADKDGTAMYLARFPRVKVESLERFDTTQNIHSQLATLQFVFLVCGAAALAVSCVGMMNLGLATIRHRSRELAIRRALGACRRENFGLVVGSALAVGIGGAAIAVVTVWAGLVFVLPALLDPEDAVSIPGFPWRAALAATGAGILTALLGALAPAVVAARVQIASVLRD